MNEILVKSLMSEQITCLTPESSLKQAVTLMVDESHSCIIINDGNLPVGIVTERDLVKILNQDLQAIDITQPIRHFMSSPVVSINHNNNLFDAIVICRAQHIRHMPVVDDSDRLVGLVTQSDLANAHFRVIDVQSKMIEASVAEKTASLQQLNDDLQAMSLEDHLMKIGNRRAMEVDLVHTHDTSTRYGHLYSLLLLDIDYFKLYNDHYGHQAGDDALKSVANLLKANIRGSDRLYRYGGEEILVVLPCTNSVQAAKVARKLVDSVASSAIEHVKSSYTCLTISCGGGCVISKSGIADNWESLVEQVDNNLYKAKNKGRNCSVVT